MAELKIAADAVDGALGGAVAKEGMGAMTNDLLAKLQGAGAKVTDFVKTPTGKAVAGLVGGGAAGAGLGAAVSGGSSGQYATSVAESGLSGGNVSESQDDLDEEFREADAEKRLDLVSRCLIIIQDTVQGGSLPTIQAARAFAEAIIVVASANEEVRTIARNRRVYGRFGG